MGSLLSIFRAKRDTKHLLEDIHNEIEAIEDLKDSSSKREKNCICLFFAAFVILYTISVLIFYRFYLVFHYSKENIIQNIVWFLPFIISPFIFIGIKRLLQLYYRWIGDNSDERLKQLKRQKKKILEKVKETENFKDAKEILEKYDPKALLEGVSLRTLNVTSTPLLTNMSQRLSTDSQLRYRVNNTPMRPLPAIMSSPIFPTQPNSAFRQNLIRGPQMTPQRMPSIPMAPPIRTVKPILPHKRTVMDKLVDYVVGDGPNNRYALICIHCYSHNGMALKEEFPYIAYICCYCKRFNPSRKTRPTPPTLEPSDHNKRSSLSSLPPVIDEPESDTESERGHRTAPQTAHIQELTTNIDSDHQNTETDIQSKSDESIEVDTETTLLETETSSEVIETQIECNEDLNNEKSITEENKEIPFMDESDQ